jgi:hypothetical protein
MRKKPKNTKVWRDVELQFLISNYETMNNGQLAEAIGFGLTSVRTKLYEIGYKRMELEYWTDEQVKFLKDNYKEIGDSELAEIYNKKWLKVKGWTKKHIEKKRRYLVLKRTDREKQVIKQRNVDQGRFCMCAVKRWLATGVAGEGEIRMWREQRGRYAPRIKINGRFVHWNRWAWEQKHGTVQSGMNVVFKDNNPDNRTIENLEVISNSELARRNAAIAATRLSDNYIAGVMSHNDKELRSELIKDVDLLDFKRLSKIHKSTEHPSFDGDTLEEAESKI